MTRMSEKPNKTLKTVCAQSGTHLDQANSALGHLTQRYAYKNMKKNTTYLLLIMTLAFSNLVLSANDTIPVNTGHKIITDNLILKLSSENSWFNKVNVTTVIVKLPITPNLKRFLENESNKIIPRETSLSASKEFREELYSTLKNKNIKFTKVIYDNKEFIVWNKKDTKTVNDTMSSIIDRALDSL